MTQPLGGFQTHLDVSPSRLPLRPQERPPAFLISRHSRNERLPTRAQYDRKQWTRRFLQGSAWFSLRHLQTEFVCLRSVATA